MIYIELILIFFTAEDDIPGLLGEGNVLGVSIEGHRFASGGKKKCSLFLKDYLSTFKSPYWAVYFRANQFEGGCGDKGEVVKQVWDEGHREGNWGLFGI